MNAPYLASLSPPSAPDWLADRRNAALARFLELGLPTVREEKWKYTSLAHLETAAAYAPPDAPSAAAEIRGYPGWTLTFADGLLAARQTNPPPRPLACNLAAMAADKAHLRRYLGRAAGNSALAWLNTAMWRDGALIHIPAGERVAPHIFLSFGAYRADAVMHPRNLVVLEAGAEAVLVEHYHGDLGAPYWQNPLTEIILLEGAQLTHLKLTEEGSAATHTGITAVLQERDSRYRALSISLGGKLARHDISVRLQGDGANARLDGLFVADGRSHVDHHLRVEHLARHATSRATYRGIAAGRGRGVFDGHIVVTPAGQHADAALSSRNLLLSRHAEIDAKPQLEIYADEVQCGHGVTVGRLDETQLFYLRSRGIDRKTASALLLRAFADEALGLLHETGLHAWLEARLLHSLPAPADATQGGAS